MTKTTRSTAPASALPGIADAASTEASDSGPTVDVSLATKALPSRVEASAENPEPAPPCGGSWTRELDGSLRPNDEGTARAAGLAWPG